MMELLLRERRATAAPPAPRPFISVIVPVRNEGRCIAGTLGMLLAQDYPADRFEVLVADGRSVDDTRAVVRSVAARHPNVRLLDNPRRWSSAGRNAAVRAARGDLLVLIDGHCETGNSRYLADLARAFERSGADCVGRPQPLDVTGASPLRRAIAAARSSPLGHNPASFIYSSAEGFVRPQSVAIAYRREVFDRVGLFDESFDACEDVEFNHRVDRAGLRCFFTPRIALHYHPRGTLAGLFRQMARYGRGRVRLLRKHRETFSPGCFVPAAFVLGLIGGPAAALLSPWLAATYAGCVGVYLLAVVLASLCLAVKARDLRLLPWLPAVFLAIHAGAGAGILLEGVVGGRREVRAA
jgi:succinoglycan biosynthesis protein ExoA